VFIDETGLNTKMTRFYGRAPLGERCHQSIPYSRWHTQTFIAALRHDRIGAPFLIEGAVDGDVFRVYVQHILVPELKKGDIVICDNLATHKVENIEQPIQACGAELIYLPPYSPDLNPIEQAFSKLKAQLRQRSARTAEELLHVLGECLRTFHSSECLNFFKHAQYATI
jgi:transposase